MKTGLHIIALLTALLLAPLANLHAAERTKPNIVVILADDLGYADYAKVAQKGSDIPPALHARDDRVFGRKAVDFITRHRAQPFFIYLAFHAPHYQQVDSGGYKELFPSPAPGRLGVRGVLAQQDDAVGLVQKALRDYGLEMNTLVFFIRDNGGTRTPVGPNFKDTTEGDEDETKAKEK